MRSFSPAALVAALALAIVARPPQPASAGGLVCAVLKEVGARAPHRGQGYPYATRLTNATGAALPAGTQLAYTLELADGTKPAAGYLVSSEIAAGATFDVASRFYPAVPASECSATVTRYGATAPGGGPPIRPIHGKPVLQ